MGRPHQSLDPGEDIVLDAGGGPVRFWTSAQGGHVYLTNKRLFHESLLRKKVTFSVPLADIAACELAKVRVLHPIPLLWLLPLWTVVRVTTGSGRGVDLNVAKPEEWVEAISSAAWVTRATGRASGPRPDRGGGSPGVNDARQ